MGVFEQFPYANMHEMNLEWLLKEMKELDQAMETFKATESLKFADPIIWDITTQYEKSTIVLDPTGDAYLSLQAVPAGVQLNNGEYWLEIFNFTEYTRTANQNLTVNTETNTTRATTTYRVDDWLIWNDVLYKVTAPIAIDDALIVAPAAGSNIVHFTVEDFIKAFITYATGLINRYKNEIDASELAYRQQLAQDIATTTASLQAQLDAAIAGATVDSEVINARIGADGLTYPTLGDANRIQFGKLMAELSSSDIVYRPAYTYNTGGFYNRDGELRTDPVYNYTNPIQVPAGTTVIVQATGYSVNVAIIAECNASGGNIVVRTQSVDNTDRIYTWYADHDTYVCISYKNTANVDIIFSNNISYIRDLITGPESSPSYTSTSGIYYNAAGDTKSSANYSYTSPIQLSKGDIIVVTGRASASIALLCTCDSQGDNRVPVIIPPDSTVRDYVFIAPEDCYVTSSYFTGAGLTVKIFSGGMIQSYYTDGSLKADDDIYRLLLSVSGEKLTTPAYTVTSGYFVNRDGSIQTANDYQYSSPIQVSGGSLIVVRAKGYNQNVAIVSECDSQGGTIAPVVISKDSTYRNYFYLMPQDGYVMISYNITRYHDIEIYYLGAIGVLNNRINEAINAPDNFNILSAFDNITCAGDSLTYSSVFTAVNTKRQAYTTYPEKLAVMTGSNVTSVAAGGYNASDWWNAFASTIVSKTNQLAIIYLGTNDGLTDTMATDMVGDDPDLWAHTYTADYGRIVDKFLSVGARVVLVKVYAGSNPTTTNSVIDQMAARFNVAVVSNPKLTDAKYHRWPDNNGSNSSHYNDLGYQAFTDQLVKNISNLNDTMMIRIIPN